MADVCEECHKRLRDIWQAVKIFNQVHTLIAALDKEVAREKENAKNKF
jgi:hypothetical protein